MTFTSVLTTAVGVLGIAGLAVLVGAALLVAVADLTGHDLVAVPVPVASDEGRS